MWGGSTRLVSCTPRNPQLARHFLGARANQRERFEDSRDFSPTTIDVGKVRVERPHAFGDVCLGHLLWRALDLDSFCREHLPEGGERIAWPDVASILVIARLCEPSSELHIAEDWYRKTALDDLLGVPSESVHHTRHYQGLDKLLVHKDALQAHLKQRLGELFDLDYDILLYDVTSTYFEGQANGNAMAQRGHSRDSRPACKQVCIGLVVTRDGYQLGYELFADNRVDLTTVEGIVEKIERLYGKPARVLVMDRGMTSEENLAWIQGGERRYLIGNPKSQLKKWARERQNRRAGSRFAKGSR